MRTFFFDTKDGVTVRDRRGLAFQFDSEAIEHSKLLADRFRHEHLHKEPDLRISVVDESGAEIHSEAVHPDWIFNLPTKVAGGRAE